MKPLLALTERCCRWPVGRHPPPGQMQHQLWCGAPRADGDWFCPEHMRIAFPRAVLKPAQVRARNLVTIKLALMRRGGIMTVEERLDDIAHNADLLGRLPMESEVDQILADASAPESAEVAAQRERLLAEVRPATAAQCRAAAFGAAVAPKSAVSAGAEAESPARADFERGAEPVQIGEKYSDPIPTEDAGRAEQRSAAGTLRPVQPLDHPVADQAAIPTSEPIIEWMAPADLLIEGAYQRDLSPKSLDLIRRIVARWDWRRFKPPIVAWTERGFEIIDGQHTAIAAATRPDIERIPVLVVEAPAMNEWADAFVGHNQDRLSITPVQMHRAKIAAGDPDAMTVQQVLDRAGASLVVGQYGQRGWKPGETIAVSTVDALAKKRGARGARMVLEVLVKAEAAPVSAAGIKAVDMLMNRPEYAEADLDHLPTAIQQSGDVESQAKLDAKTHGIPAWEAMGRIWFRKCRKKRSAA